MSRECFCYTYRGFIGCFLTLGSIENRVVVIALIGRGSMSSMLIVAGGEQIKPLVGLVILIGLQIGLQLRDFCFLTMGEMTKDGEHEHELTI